MLRSWKTVVGTALALTSAGAVRGEPPAQAPKVTIDNFVRAESDSYFRKRVEASGIGVLHHDRSPAAVDRQTIIRMNRDTPYSVGVFDLTCPVTVVKPDTQGRFQSMIVINQDHYIQLVAYDAGEYVLTQEAMGTRYVQVVFRTFVDPNDEKDVQELQRLQDAIVVKQADPGRFEVPAWDAGQLTALRKALLGLAPFVPDSKGMFGTKDEVQPVRHLVGAAGGWGGNRERDAVYLNVTPAQNDGGTPHVIRVKDVPVDGFWSITLYNKDGFFEAPVEAAAVNNVTAKQAADGSTTIHLGGDPKADNYLRIMPGWNYIVRLYRPRKEILDGSWTFPAAEPVK